MDLRNWLRSLGLGQYEDIFRNNGVDASVLPKLTADDLKEMGVVGVGHRRKIICAIEELNTRSVAQPDTEKSPPLPGAVPPDSPPRSLSMDAAERRQLTVMFCDLVGSTAMSARLDPEDMRQIIRSYQDAVSGVVARYDGFVAKFMGDGVLAYFGFPRADEDDAARAVHAGLEIAEVVAGLQPRAHDELSARVGIATGLVVVGDIVGQGAAQEQAVVGDTPNLAARLQGLADAGGVVISAATRRLIDGRFRLRDLGKHLVKGLGEPVGAWAALGVSQSESRFEAAHATRLGGFVGRKAEARELLARQRQAWEGQGQTLLISGEAGIGKSRLSAWLAEQVSETSHTRLRYQCSPYHRDSALHPFVQQFERAAGIAPDEAPEAKLDKLEKVLGLATDRVGEVVSLIAYMLSIPMGTRYPALNLSPAQQRRQTLSALLDQMEGLARKQPVLMLFEDAHWADATSLELLELAIERVRRLPVLLLVTFRPEFEARWIGLPYVETIALHRLDRAEAETLVENVTGGRRLPAEVLAQIIAKTNGVPLFVEELTKNVLESGLLVEETDRFSLDGPLPPLAIPSTLQDSLMARLDRLAAVKEIAQIGAAIGREFSYPLLYAVAGRDEASLRAALAQLQEAELVFCSGEPPSAQYTFKHALVQDTAYESLLKSRRQILHRRIAETLREKFPDTAETEPEILAYHFSRAGLPASACAYCELGGERAVARSAYAEAVAQFDAGRTEASRLPAGEERNRRELAVLLKCGPAIMVLKGVQSPEVEPIYQRAYDIAKALDDAHGLFKALWGLWFCANSSRKTAIARDRANELVALGQRSDDEALFLEAIHCRWSTAFFRGDVSQALKDAGEGLEHYVPERHSRLGAEFGGLDPGVCAHMVRSVSLAQAGSSRDAAASAERGLALAQALNQPSSLAFAFMNAMMAYQIMGDRASVLEVARKTIELANKVNLPPQRAIATFLSGWAKAHGDELVSGLEVMETEFEAACRMGHHPRYYTGLLASVRLEAGYAARAMDLLDSFLGAATEAGVGFFLPELLRLRGECLLRLDAPDLEAAVLEFEIGYRDVEATERACVSAAGGDKLGACLGGGLFPQKGVAPLKQALDAFEAGEDAPELATARLVLSELAL